MTDLTSKQDLKQRYPLSLGIAILFHFLIFSFVAAPGLIDSKFFKPRQNAIKLVGIDDIRRPRHIVDLEKIDFKKVDYKKENVAKKGLEKHQAKKLSFNDLKLDSEKLTIPARKQSPVASARPGSLPVVDGAMKGIRFDNNELKKMARESFGGSHSSLAGDKISLKYEVPNGKSLDELNEAELRLYGFLRRGAKNYTTSILAELHDFELKYPHLHFPLTDTKQVLTGRLTYDEKGNLKQIKMIRWTNIDKLQGFFEQVLKRMEVMQNPPKELWAENGEFNIFVTLEING